MSYWIPSHIQKRLLRYALSQLELLETDSLDLEQLDIAWGSRTSVELRDVGLQVQKIAKITNLPSSIQPVRGIVKSLRVTVPANIFTSGIQVEIGGVELFLRSVSSEEPNFEGHDESSTEDYIPSTEDVAEGFLADEPIAEVHELEAVILSHSVNQLDSSSADNQDGIDTDQGTGVDMALPGFLAGFLKGIVDRLEISLKNVTLSISFDVPSRDLPQPLQVNGNLSASIDLLVDHVDVIGFTSAPELEAEPMAIQNRRVISLTGIRIDLTSQRIFFATLSRVSSNSSPVASQKQSSPGLSRLVSSPTPHCADVFSEDEPIGTSIHTNSSSHSTELQQSLVAEQRSHRNAFDFMHDFETDISGPHDDKERYADASDDEDEVTDSMLASQFIGGSDVSSATGEGQAFPATYSNDSNLVSNPAQRVKIPLGRSRDSQVQNSSGHTSRASYINPSADLELSFHSSQNSSESEHNTGIEQEHADDMVESKFFTHEEAQSMYESAMSNVSPDFHKDKNDGDGQTTPRDVDSGYRQDEFSPSTPPFETTSGSRASPQDPPESAAQRPQTPPTNDAIGFDRTKVTKTLFSIDLVRILVPWAEEKRTSLDSRDVSEVGVGSQYKADSRRSTGMPGAFDTSSEWIDESRQNLQQLHSEDSLSKAHDIGEREQRLSNIQVELGNAQGQIDLSSGRLGLVLLEQLLNTAETPQMTAAANLPREQKERITDDPMSIEVSISNLRLTLQEQLGVLPSAWSSEIPASALADLTLRQTQVKIRRSGSLNVVGASIAKLALGIPGQDIISFGNYHDNVSSQPRLEIPQPDVEFKYVHSRSRGRELHVITAPALVVIDLVQIDERLECFGGLSGILDISNTIASQSTVLAPAVQRKGLLPRHTSEARNVDSTPFGAKVVLTAVHVDVRGKACAIALSSRIINLESNKGGLKIDLPRLRLKGPMSTDYSRQKPLSVVIANTSLQFLYKPHEEDLSTLLSLISPTRNPYEDDDDILIDTLLRQRKKGSVIRTAVDDISLQIADVEGIAKLQDLVGELSKLSGVAKYLPEDDRPGILTIVSVLKIHANVNVNSNVGKVSVEIDRLRLAHVGLPALFALQIDAAQVSRNEEILVGPVLPLSTEDDLPMLMLKVVGDEIEPTIKLKLFNLGLEYRVSTLMSMMGTTSRTTTEDLAASIVSSIGTIKEQPVLSRFSRQSSTLSDESFRSTPKSMKIDVLLRDCAAGLNPSRDVSRAILLLEHAQLVAFVSAADPINGVCDIHKASLLTIDDTSSLDLRVQPARRGPVFSNTSITVLDLGRQGYVTLGTISSLHVTYRAEESRTKSSSSLRLDVNCDLVVLETCADSTQTLISLLDGLKLPSAPTEGLSYFNDPMTAADLLNSFSGDAFDEGEPTTESDILNDSDEDEIIFPIRDEFEVVGPTDRASSYDTRLDESIVSIEEEDLRQTSSRPPVHQPFSDINRLKMRSNGEPLAVIADHMQTIYAKDAIHGWHSASNRYGIIPNVIKKDCPLILSVHLQTFIWNMYDGYDWAKTREVINQAVESVQQRAAKRRGNLQRTTVRAADNDDESEIGDFLFQSIWIAVPPNKDEGDLRRRIAREMDDTTSETGTMTTVGSASTNRPTLRQRRSRNLRLERGKRQKVSIEVRNLDADILVLPPSVVETQSSIDIKIGDLEIFDHVPSSTWRKFITYQREAGPRPAEKPMMHLELQNVKPKPELAATEMVIRTTVLPLRLHVDQDTLDFITRFFEFKDTSKISIAKGGEEPFIQRIEVRAVSIKLDYKPKKVDYAGLRSGRAKEFMNFVILDGADILLKRLIVFGISGFDRLHKILNDLWVSDVTSNQLPTVLQGLAPLRPLVNVGSGVRNLIVVPMKEYQKDGRLVRSLGKGAIAFAKTTTSELARLGARVAIGTGNILQGAETLLSPGLSTSPSHGQDYDSDSHLSASPSSRAVSSYANQPLTVAAGLRSAVRHLERDLVSARDAIIAVGADIRESDNAGELARAVFRGAPAVILKPAIGTTKAVGTALLGAGNALDAESWSKLEDKYKA